MKVSLYQGSLPVLISLPHAGSLIPGDVASRMTGQVRELADTVDFWWRLAAGLTDQGASLITPNFSRYLIDVDETIQPQTLDVGPLRSPLCPWKTPEGGPVYLAGEEPDAFEVGQRVAEYWQPFHDDLQEEWLQIRHRHGRVVLLIVREPRASDTQTASIPSSPTSDPPDVHCDPQLWQRAEDQLQPHPEYQLARRGQGFLATHYGQPKKHAHALQVNLAADCPRHPAAEARDHRVTRAQATLCDLIQRMASWACR